MWWDFDEVYICLNIFRPSIHQDMNFEGPSQDIFSTFYFSNPNNSANLIVFHRYAVFLHPAFGAIFSGLC